MLYQSQFIQDKLPPIEKIKLRNEADYYGASYLIFEQLKQKKLFGLTRHLLVSPVGFMDVLLIQLFILDNSLKQEIRMKIF